MGLSVTTHAQITRLTTKERVRLALTSISGSGSDAILDALIDASGSTLQGFCNRGRSPFYRQSYAETLGGFGDTSLMLLATPIVEVSSVLFDSTTLSDWTIDDADAGILYRRDRFAWTAQLNAGLSGRQTWPGFGSPIPMSEERRFTVAYTAGYLLPGHDVSAKTTISADGNDNSFNATDACFPALLKAGDVFTVSGFSTAANNGVFVATGTPTASKIVVTGATISTESAPVSSAIIFRNLPHSLEMAAVECVRSWYLDLERNPAIMSESVADVQMQYFKHLVSDGLPPLAAVLAREFVRSV